MTPSCSRGPARWTTHLCVRRASSATRRQVLEAAVEQRNLLVANPGQVLELLEVAADMLRHLAGHCDSVISLFQDVVCGSGICLSKDVDIFV
jgi:hypothetical protein